MLTWITALHVDVPVTRCRLQGGHVCEGDLADVLGVVQVPFSSKVIGDGAAGGLPALCTGRAVLSSAAGTLHPRLLYLRR